MIPHPPSGVAHTSWGRLMQEMQQPDTISAPVASYLAHLAVVEKQVEFICDEIDTNGVGPTLVQHSARLSQAARQMSDLGLGALNALEDHVGGAHHLLHAQHGASARPAARCSGGARARSSIATAASSCRTCRSGARLCARR